MTPVQSIFYYGMLIGFAFILLSLTVQLFQLLRAAYHLRQYRKEERYADHGRFIKSENTIPVTILMPAYNEAHSILDTVRNLLSLQFPEYEVIIINDGSVDNTLLLLKLEYELVALQQPYKRSLNTREVRAIYRSPLYPNLIVVDKEHGGKADALNVGINISDYPVFVTMEADSILEKDSLVKIIMPFINDFRVVGLSGMVRIASGWKLKDGQPGGKQLSKSPLICFQSVEYLRTFLMRRIGQETLGMIRILAGSFGAYNKSAVVEVGGYTNECIGEDLDLAMRLHKHMLEKGRAYSIQFLTSPVCWVKSPNTYHDLTSQRKRWHGTLMDSLQHYKKMLFNPQYKKLGMVSLPYYWLFEYFGPLLETLAHVFLIGAWVSGAVSWLFALSTFLLAALYGTVLNVGALLFEERSIERYETAREMLRQVLYSFLDNMGYRQINALQCVIEMLQFSKTKKKFREEYPLKEKDAKQPEKQAD